MVKTSDLALWAYTMLEESVGVGRCTIADDVWVTQIMVPQVGHNNFTLIVQDDDGETSLFRVTIAKS